MSDAGGGVVDILVDRDTENYPLVGDFVEVIVKGPKAVHESGKDGPEAPARAGTYEASGPSVPDAATDMLDDRARGKVSDAVWAVADLLKSTKARSAQAAHVQGSATGEES